MKTIAIFIVGVSICSILSAQTNQPAIYKTCADFNLKQNPVPINCTHHKGKIKVCNFFLEPYLYYNSDKGKSKIHLDSIYGFIDCHGNNYRIWNKKAWLLCETGALNIYSQTGWKDVKVCTSKGYRLKRAEITDYFFSMNDTSEIHPLTLAKVYETVNYNGDFLKKLYNQFPNDKALTMNNNNQFIINNFIKENK